MLAECNPTRGQPDSGMGGMRGESESKSGSQQEGTESVVSLYVYDLSQGLAKQVNALEQWRT